MFVRCGFKEFIFSFLFKSLKYLIDIRCVYEPNNIINIIYSFETFLEKKKKIIRIELLIFVFNADSVYTLFRFKFDRLTVKAILFFCSLLSPALIQFRWSWTFSVVVVKQGESPKRLMKKMLSSSSLLLWCFHSLWLED